MLKRKALLPVIMGSMLFIMAGINPNGCGDNSENYTEQSKAESVNKISDVVVTFVPVNGAKDVSKVSEVSFTTSGTYPTDLASTVTLKSVDGGVSLCKTVSPDVRSDGTHFVCAHDPLQAGANYTFLVRGLKDTSGNVVQDASSRFTTETTAQLENAVDVPLDTPITLPIDGAVDVPLDTQITFLLRGNASFPKGDMDSSVFLKKDNTGPSLCKSFTPNVTSEGTVYTCVHDPLEAGTGYVLWMTVIDTVSTWNSNSANFFFTKGTPDAIIFMPSDGAKDVPIDVTPVNVIIPKKYQPVDNKCFEVKKDNAGSSLCDGGWRQAGADSILCSCRVPPQLGAGSYTISIVAKDSDGQSPSATSTFTFAQSALIFVPSGISK